MGFILNPYRFAEDAGFTDPTDIAGLAAWYDASDTSTITASGSDVTQLDDKSGNARHLTPGGGTGPSTGTRSLNSLNVLDFASPRRLRRSPFWRALGDSTVFVVAIRDGIVSGSNPAGVVIECNDFGTNNDEYGLRASGAGSPYSMQFLGFDDEGSGVEFIISGSVSNAEWALWSATDTTTATELFKNGTSVASDASYTRIGTVGLNRFSLGYYDPGALRYLDGAIAEVIIYDSVLSTTDRQAVEDYLTTKWGL